MFWSCCLRSRHGRAQKCEFSFRWLLTTLRNWLLSWMTKKNNPSQTPPGKQLFSSVRNEQKRDLTLTHVLAAQIFPLRCLLTFFSSPKTLFFSINPRKNTRHTDAKDSSDTSRLNKWAERKNILYKCVPWKFSFHESIGKHCRERAEHSWIVWTDRAISSVERIAVITFREWPT